MATLEYTTNLFQGVVVKPDTLPLDLDEFQKRLVISLEIWRKERLQLVWLEVPIERSELIPIAVRENFIFHHSSNDYLMLTRPLTSGAVVPNYATHYIGAGGVVLNEQNELLVVSERHRGSKDPSYKLPGGALHPGEHLEECVIREVREETGVHTEFQALVCFRHWHGYRFGKSDIYFVCRLRPLNHELAMQHEEIEECLWMPVSDYLSSPYVHTFNRRIVRAALNSSGVVPISIDGYSNLKTHEIFMPPTESP